MRYGIFSDVHSNLPALQTVLKAYAEEKIDRYVCIGDIVGYAASPKECIAEIRKLNPLLVAGNHDWACVDLLNTQDFNSFAQEAVAWTRGQLSKEEKEFLTSLELVLDNDDFILAHGTLDNAENFNYLYDQMDAQVTFELMSGRICFVGHTHIPGIFTLQGNRMTYSQKYPLWLTPQNKYIVNVGSVGQPRDRDPRASYCVLDTESGMVEIKRIGYDIKEAQEKITSAGLPAFLAERLSSGR
jgi:diadenosine tetraphosphatase ApaH/serine/threonine PP2A family protein phosphatase